MSYTPIDMFRNIGSNLKSIGKNVKSSAAESATGLKNRITGNRNRRMQPSKENIQTFTCDNPEAICNGKYITENITNLIKFYLTKGSCSSLHFLRGKRNVSIYSYQNRGFWISFNDLEFDLKLIEECSELTPFVSYKQLSAFHYKLNHRPSEERPLDLNRKLKLFFLSIMENPINRSGKPVTRYNNNQLSYQLIQIHLKNYNQMIIETHQKNKTLLRNRLTGTGSTNDIHDMVCNMDFVPIPHNLPIIPGITEEPVEANILGTSLPTGPSGKRPEGGKKKTTRKRSSSTSSKKKTSTKKKTTTKK